MKWPKDNKERVKILVLIGMGAAVAIYLIIAGAVKPILTKRKDYAKEAQDIRGYLEQARKKISFRARDEEANYAAITSIKEMTDNYLLKPQLGKSYLLSAKKILQNHAEDIGFLPDSVGVREIGIREIPKPKGSQIKRVFKSWTADVTIACDLNDLIEFLAEIEQANPYACVSRLSIMTQAKEPGRHRISFEIQWPIWADSENETKLEEQLKEAEEARREDEKTKAETAPGQEGSVTSAPEAEAKEGGQ